jgi:hypothetical protein
MDHNEVRASDMFCSEPFPRRNLCGDHDGRPSRGESRCRHTVSLTWREINLLPHHIGVEELRDVFVTASMRKVVNHSLAAPLLHTALSLGPAAATLYLYNTACMPLSSL